MKVYQFIMKYKESPFSADSIIFSAASSDIAPEDLTEIKDRLNKTSTFVTNTSIKKSPMHYSFFTLKSGKYCFLCGRALDENNKDYILHGLIFDEMLPFYPIELIGSTVFNIDNIDSLNNNEIPVLQCLQKGNAVTYENTANFIKSRMELGYDDMLSAVVEHNNLNRPIVIRDTYDNICLWIASIIMAFPVDTAHKISFSIWNSCIKDTNTILQGLDKNIFSIQISNEDCFMYDYERGIITRLSNQFDYIKIVKTGYLISRATIESFHRFMHLFKYIALDEGIESCYHLFILCNMSGAGMDSHDIESAFKFVNEYSPDDMREYILNVLNTSIEKVIHIIDINAAKAAAEFLFKTAIDSGKPALIERSCYLFYAIIDHLVFDYIKPDYNNIYKIYLDASNANQGRNMLFFKYSLTPERLNYMTANLSKNYTAERTALYLRFVLTSATEVGLYWSQLMHIQNMGLSLDLCIKSLADCSMEIAYILSDKLNNEFFSMIAVLFYNRITNSQVSQAFLNIFAEEIDKKDEYEKLEIRKQIFSTGCGRLLYDEFVLRLSKAQDKPGFFEEYNRSVFDKIIDYARQYFSNAAKLYIQKLPYEFMFSESQKLLRQYMDNIIMIDDEGLKWAIKGFEDTLTLSEPDDDMKNFISKLKKIKKSKSIITSPDILCMMDLPIWLKKEKTLFSIDEILKDPIDVDKLDEKRYINYISWCLPLIINHCKTPEDHKRVIRVFSHEDMDIELFDIYINSIGQVLSSSDQKGFELLLYFCIYYFFYMEPKYKILNDEEVLNKVKNMLIEIFKKRSQTFKDEFDKRIKQEFESRGLSVPIQWKEIYNNISAAEREKQPLIKKIISKIKRS